MEKILQIVVTSWVGKSGDRMENIVGLGEDSNLYKWHRGTGKWVLYIISQ